MCKNFSSFGKFKSSPKEICKLFDLTFEIERLEFSGDLPQEYLPEIKALEEKLERQIKRFEINNEIGKRDFLIAPVFSQLFDWVDFELATEKYFDLEDGLRGNIDYVIKGGNEILVVEAKNDDFDGGAIQIIAELVAVGRFEQRSQLFGVVTNGRFWQFYEYNVDQKVIIQDIDFYSFPKESEAVFSNLLEILR